MDKNNDKHISDFTAPFVDESVDESVDETADKRADEFSASACIGTLHRAKENKGANTSPKSSSASDTIPDERIADTPAHRDSNTDALCTPRQREYQPHAEQQSALMSHALLSTTKRPLADSAAKPDDLLRQNASLRSRILDLETYIDGRKSHWKTLAAECVRMQANLTLARHSIEIRESRIKAYARTTARLQKRIEEQNTALSAFHQSQTSNFRGELSTEPHQAEIATQVNARLRGAQRKLITMRDEQNRLQAELQEKSAHIDELCGKIARMELERTKTTSTLQKQRRVIDRIELEIRARMAKAAIKSRKPRAAQKISANIYSLDERRTQDGCKDRIFNGRLTVLDAQVGCDDAFSIGRLPLIIGRAPDSDIRLRWESISRRHARLLVSADGVAIEDLDSRNGVRVNDRAVRCQRLSDGDIVTIGRIRFRFEDLLNDPSLDNAS